MGLKELEEAIKNFPMRGYAFNRYTKYVKEVLEVEFDKHKKQQEDVIKRITEIFDSEINYDEAHKTKPSITSLKLIKFEVLQLLGVEKKE